MTTKAKINEIKDGIYVGLVGNFNKLSASNTDRVKTILNGDLTVALEEIPKIMKSIGVAIKEANHEGVYLPEYIDNFTVYDDGDLSEFTLSIRSKLKAKAQVKRKFTIAINEDMFTAMTDAYVKAVYEMFYKEMAVKNIEALNARLDSIYAEHEFPCTFKFDIEDSRAVVLSATDKEVVFNASLEVALDIPSLSIMQEGNEYLDLICAKSVADIVDTLTTCQTAPMVIKSKLDLIKKVTGVSTKKRASEMIRASYHRKLENLGGVKEGFGYFEKEYEVDGEPTKIFAIVEKTKDEGMKVVLSPFDVKTCFNVEYDVLAEVQ